ncbi:MAG: protein-glutamate O-methyltransferase CheR [Gammaproteobacteria bacterium]|nr:protein-glutamate O-methyltransferase CheR [Gammaproteobacteria bacterium]MDH5660653.1 protein-glutamate O-methyltransferase CheR [Gammaproteobacteria bacterium]
MDQSPIAANEYNLFRSYLEEACGIVLGENKHYLVTSRLKRVTEEFSYPSLSEMMKTLIKGNDRNLREKVIDAMTTNETMWFRDVYPFEILKKELLPELAKNKSPIKIWSAASSTGQEAYSISMGTSEFQQSNPGKLTSSVEIVGTDISQTVVNLAKQGRYDELSVVRGLSAERRDKFFKHKDDKWEINLDIKQRTRFLELNLLNNYSLLGKFDIIFCRNVLIYFSSEMKKDILERMAKILKPGGTLILGGSESPTGYTKEFEMVRYADGVVYRLHNKS